MRRLPHRARSPDVLPTTDDLDLHPFRRWDPVAGVKEWGFVSAERRDEFCRRHPEAAPHHEKRKRSQGDFI
jgi:hypothetical protein